MLTANCIIRLTEITKLDKSRCFYHLSGYNESVVL